MGLVQSAGRCHCGFEGREGTCSERVVRVDQHQRRCRGAAVASGDSEEGVCGLGRRRVAEWGGGGRPGRGGLDTETRRLSELECSEGLGSGLTLCLTHSQNDSELSLMKCCHRRKPLLRPAREPLSHDFATTGHGVDHRRSCFVVQAMFATLVRSSPRFFYSFLVS